MKMPLEKARLCLECDTVHDLRSCPQCGSTSFYYLANWIKAKEPPHEPAPENKPPAELPKKKSHWVRNSLLAAGSAIAAYNLLFKQGPKKRPPEEDE